MSAASVERPSDDRAADPARRRRTVSWSSHPGYRVEIIGGLILVTPPPDGPHADALTRLMSRFWPQACTAPRHGCSRAIGLWLPGGPEDYAIPDLAVVDARLPTTTTSRTTATTRLLPPRPGSDVQQLEARPADQGRRVRRGQGPGLRHRRPQAPAPPRAHRPDRRHYDNHRIYAPGELVTLPDSIGAKVTLDVDELLAAGRPQPRKKFAPPAPEA